MILYNWTLSQQNLCCIQLSLTVIYKWFTSSQIALVLPKIALVEKAALKIILRATLVHMNVCSEFYARADPQGSSSATLRLASNPKALESTLWPRVMILILHFHKFPIYCEITLLSIDIDFRFYYCIFLLIKLFFLPPQNVNSLFLFPCFFAQQAPRPLVLHSTEFEDALASLCIMVAPMAPHIASEMWKGIYKLHIGVLEKRIRNLQECL